MNYIKYIKLLLFIILPVLLNAQTATKDRFAGYGVISGTSLVSADTFNFTISGFAGNNRPYGNSAFVRADVAVGDKI